MQSIAQGRDLEKWCILNFLKQQGSRGCNIFEWRRQGRDANCHRKGHPII
jgi:hypothetical protein